MSVDVVGNVVVADGVVCLVVVLVVVYVIVRWCCFCC